MPQNPVGLGGQQTKKKSPQQPEGFLPAAERTLLPAGSVPLSCQGCTPSTTKMYTLGH
jgi:hypothetical protein